ncbi:MAG: endonuclease/exonuclease/phosphatase family protein [Cellulosilyticaceae bacterium]
MEKLKVVTFNIRCDCVVDGKNRFELRKDLIEKKIKQECPDIIGFQEIQPHMISWFKDTFIDYYIVGCGRDIDYSGEHVAIAYRKEYLEVIDTETFWLSQTPKKAGSRFDKQSIYPRICTVITFKHAKIKQLFQYYNTHLDHEEEEARLLGLELILEKIKGNEKQAMIPIILAGDFNAEPSSKEIQLLKDFGRLEDCTESLEGTFHGFGALDTLEKIDYIYTSQEIVWTGTEVWDDRKDDVYLSDHYPIAVTLEML